MGKMIMLNMLMDIVYVMKDREEFANVIASAVSAALTAWSESHKDLTVQFSDSPEKIFGEVYNI